MQWLSSLSCLSSGLDLIPLWPCCAFAWYPMALYPVMRTDTKLDQLTQWCNGNIIAKVWEYKL
jgi:hypothetical protein